jgi:hypothetical protein
MKLSLPPSKFKHNRVDHIAVKVSLDTTDHANKIDPYSLLIKMLHHQWHHIK